jgi:hypothetical protein
MNRYPWLRPSHLAFMFAVYAGFAVAGGIITFMVIWAYGSPHSFITFLLGVVTGIAVGIISRLKMNDGLLRRASHKLAHSL